MNGGDPLAPFAAGVFKSEVRDAARGAVGDDLQALDDARHDFVFEAAVEVFGILADDDEVNVFVARLDALERFNRPQVGIQIERFSEPHVGADEACADGSHNRPFERDLGAFDRFKEVLRQRVAEA